MPELKIEGQPWEDDVQELHAAGWTSVMVALWLKSRYGVDVSARGVRSYCARHRAEIDRKYGHLIAPDGRKLESPFRSDEFTDSLGQMNEAIRLQRDRVLTGWRAEQANPNDGVRLNVEVRLWADLVAKEHELRRDYGLAPKAPVHVEVVQEVTMPEIDTRLRPIELARTAEERQLMHDHARLIHELGKRADALEHGGNGHVERGGYGVEE